MPEGLFRPEELNIHQMAVEQPKASNEVLYLPEDLIDEATWQALLDILNDPKHSNEYKAQLILNMRLFRPDRLGQLHATTVHKEQLIKKANESQQTALHPDADPGMSRNATYQFLLYTATAKQLFPEFTVDISPSLYPSIHEAFRYFSDNFWTTSEIAKMMVILDCRQAIEIEIEEILNTGYKAIPNHLAGRSYLTICQFLANSRLIAPDRFRPELVTQDLWEVALGSIKSNKANGYAFQALRNSVDLKILAALSVAIENGQIVFDSEPTILEEATSPKLPEVRKY